MFAILKLVELINYMQAILIGWRKNCPSAMYDTLKKSILECD